MRSSEPPAADGAYHCLFGTDDNEPNPPTFPTLAASLKLEEIIGVPYGALVSALTSPPNIRCEYRRRQDYLRDGAGPGVGSLGPQRVIPKACQHRRDTGCGRFV